jgi:hypothetical protein
MASPNRPSPEVRLRRAPEDAAAHDAGAEQRARLRAVQPLQIGERHVVAALRLQVRDLAADEAGSARGRAQDAAARSRRARPSPDASADRGPPGRGTRA